MIPMIADKQISKQHWQGEHTVRKEDGSIAFKPNFLCEECRKARGELTSHYRALDIRAVQKVVDKALAELYERNVNRPKTIAVIERLDNTLTLLFEELAS